MSEHNTGGVRDLLTRALTLMDKCLVEGIQMFGLGRAVRVEDEDDAVSVSLYGRPALFILVTPASVPQLHLSLENIFCN